VGSVIGNVELFYDSTLPEGYYNLTITETTLGCQLDTFFIINEPPTELILTTGGVSPDCNANDGIAFVQATGGMAPYTYDWPIAPGINNDSIENLIPGVYNVMVTDDLGCTMETQATIMPGDNLNIEIDIVNSLNCDGTGQGTLEANILNSTYPILVYNWTNPAGDVLGSNTTLSFTAPGEYILNVNDPNMNCFDSDTVFIDPAGVFTFDIAINDPSCVGSSNGEALIANFQGGVGPYFCEWEDAGITDCNPTTLSAGTYFLTVSDNAGCRIDTFIELFETGVEITFDLDIQNPSCVEAIDGSISFLNFAGGTGPFECEWEDQSIIGCPRTGLSAGDYAVTITNADGCEKDTIITLTDPEPIEIEVNNSDIVDVSCFGGADGQAIAIVSNNPSGTSSFNFSWSNPADNINSSGLTDDATQLSAGLNYVLVFDNNSCASDTVFFMVNQPDKLQLNPAASIIGSASCKGECDGSATLAATGGTLSNSSNYEFLWEDGTRSATNSGLCPGIYYVTISDDNGCMELDSIEIIEPDTLTVEIDLNGTVNLSCFGDESGSIQVRSNGGCGGYTYTWTNNVSTGSFADNLSEGNYTITVTDGCGCTDITQYTLESSDEIIAQPLSPDMPDCFGNSTCIGIETATGGVGNNYTYSINFGDRIPIDSCVEVIAGMYTLTVFDSVGCSVAYATTVDQPEQIEVDLGPDIVLDLGDSTAMITAIINGPNPIDSINWISNTGFTCIDPSCNTIAVNATTFSTYEVIVTDTNGCEGRDKIDVFISAKRNVFAPNIFNPDDLPPNDKFMLLTGEGVVSVEYLRIFDRWGNLVFEKENIPHPTSVDDGWDGRKANKIVEQGVYVYVAEVRFIDNKLIQYKGDITVIR
ncbi:MAG: gliding motility-associated C-terminal domain-containing protein, partial [Bacteroidia bacterium]|nr:gliding motility-associated C-terminal domain-containing protein [Bacteroidia bacterium]